jgi:mono/diheme cytochrome c family protein
MTKLNAGWKGWLAASVVAVLLAACGTGSGPSLTGVAQAGGPVVGKVTVVDASAVPRRATAATGADGAFTVDTTGMTPPFLLKVEGTSRSQTVRLFSATGGDRGADVNPITSAAFSGGAGECDEGDDDDEFEQQDGRRHHDTAGRVTKLLAQLQVALAPLFERYGITDPATDRAAVRQLLEDVRFEVRRGVLTVTNRETDAVIFTGRLDDLAAGTFDPAAMPPGPGTPPPPPTGDGAALYEASCASCHGPLATSDVRGESAGEIREAIEEDEGGMGALSGLSLTQLQAIAAALSGTSGGGGGTPGACVYTYGAWSACMDGTQTRTVLSSTPTGCTGTPMLTQACSVTPPPIDGAALYTTHCAGCHGNSMKGRSAASIQSAIDSNRGGMGTAALRALTPEQIAAIAAAP